LTADPPQLASLSYLGPPAAGPCQIPRLSANGRFLTFVCLSADIVPGDDNERSDTFMLDRSTRQVKRASLNAANGEQRNTSGLGIPAEDGSFVVFYGEGFFHPDIIWIPPPTADSAQPNVYLRNFDPPRTDLISRAASGEGNPDRLGALLRDALPQRREVLFASRGDYLGDDTGGPQPRSQLYVRNWQTGLVERVSARRDGGSSARDAGIGRLSSDGRFAVFTSSASDLTLDNPLSYHQLFLRDRLLATTRRLTFPWRGGEFSAGVSNGPNFIGAPAITRDGRKALFTAGLNDEFTHDDNPGFGDTYLLDTQSGNTELVSRSHDGSSTDGTTFYATMSEDGRIVAYYTRATNTLAVPNPQPAIYVKDMLTGEVVNVTASLGGLPNQSPTMDLSADGRVLAFDWLVDNPALPDMNRRNLIFTVELRGIEPPRPVVPVPSLSQMVMALLATLLAFVASCAYRRSRFRTA
jgi:Tol biopolymer transport system component